MDVDVKRVVVDDAKWIRFYRIDLWKYSHSKRKPKDWAEIFGKHCQNVAQIRGLVNRSDLNFRLVRIVGEGTTKERKRVMLEGMARREQLSIREKNLFLLTKMQISGPSMRVLAQYCEGRMSAEDFRNSLAFQENLGLGSDVKDLLNKSFKIQGISSCILTFTTFHLNPFVLRFALTCSIVTENMDIFEILLTLPCIDINLPVNIGRFDAPPFEHAICKDLYGFASRLLDERRLDINFHPFCHCIGTDVDEPSPDASRLYSWRHFLYNCPDKLFLKFLRHPSLHLDTAWFAYKSLAVKLDMIEVNMFQTFGLRDVETGSISKNNVDRLRARVEKLIKFMRPIFKSTAKLTRMQKTSLSVEVRTLVASSLDDAEKSRSADRDRIQEMMSQPGIAQMLMGMQFGMMPGMPSDV